MRIASGALGYYFDQGWFKRPEVDTDETAQQQAAVPQRSGSFSPVVESSTVLSTHLSSALWQLETRAHQDEQSRTPAPGPLPVAGATDEETADKVSALYREYGDAAA